MHISNKTFLIAVIIIFIIGGGIFFLMSSGRKDAQFDPFSSIEQEELPFGNEDDTNY